MTTDSATKSPEQRWRSVFAEPVVAIVLSILLTIALRLLLEKVWPYLSGLRHLWWFRTVATIVLSLSGGALFLFKKRFQTMYGWSETCFAVFVIGTGIERVQTAGDAASWSAMVGGVYLIVRGLTNCDEGLKKRTRNR
jgi:type II secretory pathway component PulF